MKTTQADQLDALEREQDQAHRLTRRLPVGFFALGVLAAVLISHVIVGPFIAAQDQWQIVVIDVAIILPFVLVGWFLRTSYEGARRGKLLESWESPYGTAGLGAVCLIIALGFSYWALRTDASWLGIGGLSVAAAVSAIAIPKRVMLDPGDVILSGEQPDNLGDFIRKDFELPPPRSSSGQQEPIKVGLWVNKESLETYRNINPGTQWDGNRPRFEWYVERGRCPEVNTLADALTHVSRSNGLNRTQEVRLVLDLVQSMPYKTDAESTQKDDYWRFPIETIADGEGDCEDTAVLAVALLSAMGHRSCFFDMPGHVAMGVAELPESAGVRITAADGRHFAYVETTSKPFLFGELPPGVLADDIMVGAIVAPLKGRNKANDLVEVGRDEWAADSRTLFMGTAVTMTCGAVLALVLAFVS